MKKFRRMLSIALVTVMGILEISSPVTSIVNAQEIPETKVEDVLEDGGETLKDENTLEDETSEDGELPEDGNQSELPEDEMSEKAIALDEVDGDLQSEVEVESFEELKLAIENPEITTIKITKSIDFKETIVVDRDVNIKGTSNDIILGISEEFKFNINTEENDDSVLRHFKVTKGKTLNIEDLTIKGIISESIEGGRGGIENFGNMNIQNCIFLENQSSIGGAINNDDYGQPSGTKINIKNTEFENNKAVGKKNGDFKSAGGAICSFGNNIEINISDTKFKNNKAEAKENSLEAQGGAIYHVGDFGKLNINGVTTFQENEAIVEKDKEENEYYFAYGGAIFCNAEIEISGQTLFKNNKIEINCKLAKNKSYAKGGAVNIATPKKATIDGATFIGNSAKIIENNIDNVVSGGALSYSGYEERLNIKGVTTFQENEAIIEKTNQGSEQENRKVNSKGGAINIESGETAISGESTEFIENKSDLGGAINIENGKIKISGESTEFIKNKSDLGGAIYSDYGKTEISGKSTEFIKNESDLGGAIYIEDGEIKISGETTNFSQNTSEKNGGAIYIEGGETEISGKTTNFSQNTSEENGGAIYIEDGEIKISGESTNFSQNTSEKKGGAIYIEDGEIKISGKTTNFIKNKAISGGTINIGQLINSDEKYIELSDVIEVNSDSKLNFIGNKSQLNASAITLFNHNIKIGDSKLFNADRIENNKNENYNIYNAEKQEYDENLYDNILVIYNIYDDVNKEKYPDGSPIDDRIIGLADAMYYDNMKFGKIILNPNGGLLGDSKDNKAIDPLNTFKDGKYKEVVIEEFENPTREGYVFKDWDNKEKIDKELIGNINKLINYLNSEDKEIEIPFDVIDYFNTDKAKEYLKGKNIELVAKWEKEEKPDKKNNGSSKKRRKKKEDETEIIEENTLLHKAYLFGYEDETIKPENNLTREEASAVLDRITENKPMTKMIYNYKDVEQNRWSYNNINNLSNKGGIKGYPEGDFKPENKITRAEAATILVRLENAAITNKNIPEEIREHWAREEIVTAIDKGWIKGYEDGSIKPDDFITRAEFVTLVNRMQNRKINSENILENIKYFKDLDKDEWYYTDIVEATNTHNYKEKRLEDGSEKWTGIIK